MDKKLIVWFDEVDKDDVGLVGGKGANLGEMLSGGFPIPYGFIVTSHAYFYVVEQNRLKHRIKHAVTNINYENSKELHAASSQIKKLFLKAEIPEDLTKTIVSYYHELVLRESRVFRKNKLQKALKHVKSAINSPLTAVRSSATAEDLPEASFAGQQDTFLNVKGENHLLEKVKACWASLFTERAMYYRHNNGFDHMKVGLAAVVQRMVQSQQSGIAFSIDPVTNDKSVISIEAILGLGEYIVQGKVTPDHYEISKSTYAIINKQIKTQKIKLVKRGVDTREVKVPRTKGESQKISDKTIVELAKIIHAIEKHYYFPQDIEWAVEEGQIFIVQSRPITTINTKTKTDKLDTQGFKVILKGSPASPGIASGEPVVVNSPSEINKVKKGMVLVARQTSPDYVPAMKRAAAIVTEVGGRTSHAAIVSRELSVPAVVGAEDAKTLLSGISTISVNGSTGEVYEGVVHGSSSAQSGATDKLDYITKRLQTVYAGHGETLDKQTVEQKAKQSRAKLKTVTKIYVNLAQTEKAKEVAQKNVDGVGLLRAEFIIADIGTHPRKIIQKGQQKEFIKVLSERLIDVVKPFAPRPV
ncbi:MAG: PEP/pyruvate-binding domain-containing protein, partial [Candidatus Paceibacterota bacterium]